MACIFLPSYTLSKIKEKGMEKFSLSRADPYLKCSSLPFPQSLVHARQGQIPRRKTGEWLPGTELVHMAPLGPEPLGQPDLQEPQVTHCSWTSHQQ